jgi:uncharacterized protein YkwD
MGQVIRTVTLVGMLLAGVPLAEPGAIAAPVPVQRVAQAASLSAMEQAINTQINQYRSSRGLPALKLDPTVSEQARIHSQNMASGRVKFSHDGFDQRARAIGRTIAFRGVAENVAYNQGYATPDRQAVQGWIKSAGHHKNIVGQYTLTGIGVARNSKGEFYFTQIFVRR